MAWNKGPLPPGTYLWGGVVPINHKGSGFFFADFRGDHVVVNPGDPQYERKITAEEVRWWNNGLDLPPEKYGAIDPAGPPNDAAGKGK
jgi:hypothetical protein